MPKKAAKKANKKRPATKENALDDQADKKLKTEGDDPLPFPDAACGEVKITEEKALLRHLGTKTHYNKVQKFVKSNNLPKASHVDTKPSPHIKYFI